MSEETNLLKPKEPKDAKYEARQAIFSNKNRKVKQLEVFGILLEVRQPSLGDILSLQDMSSKDRVARALINYCYLPATGEKVFEETDIASIMSLPFDENLEKIQDAIAELTGVNIKEEEGN